MKFGPIFGPFVFRKCNSRLTFSLGFDKSSHPEEQRHQSMEVKTKNTHPKKKKKKQKKTTTEFRVMTLFVLISWSVVISSFGR
jgi:hypothetical protein